MPPLQANVFRADLRLAQDTIHAAVCDTYARKKINHWTVWLQFCTECRLDPFLANITDPVPYILVFAQRYRDGRLALSGKPVSAKCVSDVIRSVGQTFAGLGAKDPRLSAIDGKLDFRLRRQARFWGKQDPPPARVKPLPVTIVLFLVNLAYQPQGNPNLPREQSRAYADMICLAFYYLLRPSEYSHPDASASVFTLDDVHCYIGQRKLDIATASYAELTTATSVRLHFDTQKNQRRGDVLAHARSNHRLCCPVLALTRLLWSHRCWFSRTATPFDGTVRLASYYHNDTRVHINASDLTGQIRFAARNLYPTTGIDPAALTARSCRAGGAMALLMSRCDKNQMQLLGRWHSDCMFQYLHQEAEPVLQRLSQRMFNDGTYSFLPTAMVPLL